MAVVRMDNVAIVVQDLDAGIAFFADLGLELEGRQVIKGIWADRTVGLDGIRSEIAVLRTPDGNGRVELAQYYAPVAEMPAQAPAANTVGLHRIMFAVDDIDATIERLRPHGAEVMGEVAQFEQMYRLCYLRGPDGIIVALAEQIGSA
jgi:catechol 2,3-dioxygenase-like lactoylglutathione lyase family enzyme